MRDLWWTKCHWGRFSPSTSVSPANSHSTDYSTLIIIWGWYNRPNIDRRTKWTQAHPTPRKKEQTLVLHKAVSVSFQAITSMFKPCHYYALFAKQRFLETQPSTAPNVMFLPSYFCLKALLKVCCLN
jgi:hypothetical protein